MEAVVTALAARRRPKPVVAPVTRTQALHCVPLAVRALAQRLGVDPNCGPHAVEMAQEGEMWLAPHTPAIHFSARETLRSDRLEFLWKARCGPFGCVAVTDGFEDGKGALSASLFGMSLARAQDDSRIDEGEVLRYLAELPWNPDAILGNPALQWLALDERTLAVQVDLPHSRPRVMVHLDSMGLFESVSTEARGRMEAGKLVNRAWRGRFWGYRGFAGRLIPSRGEIGWVLDGEDFVYWRGQVRSWQTVSLTQFGIPMEEFLTA
jgi:hypothetical protein